MRTIFCACLVLLSSVVFRGWGCLAPSNLQGVAFTNEERVNIELLQSMGIEGESYLVDGKAPEVAVRYRSHYDERAMVYVGTYGLSYQEDVPLTCMGVVLDPSILQDLYQPPSVEVFDFTQAVVTEINWLVEQGILELSEETVQKIAAALGQASNGGVQYWTLQEDVLAYNSWYSYDDQNGVWGSKGARGVEGVDAVNGAGCAAISPQFETVSAPLAGASPVAPDDRGMNAERLTISPTVNGEAVFHLSRPSHKPLFARMVSLNGKVVAQFTIPAGVSRYSMDKSRLAGLGTAPCLLELPGAGLRLRFIPVAR